MNEHLSVQASRAVNVGLTLRNWMIGFYIAEFELSGSDRARYGNNLLSELSNILKKEKVSSTGRRQLYNYLLFYRTYPQIREIIPAKEPSLISVYAEGGEKVRTPSAQLGLSAKHLINIMGYSHFELLIHINDPHKRSFYEVECMRGNWSVRELKRQIGSLYYERSGLSQDKMKLAKLIKTRAEVFEPKLAVKDPYVFEFLGISSREVMGESELEDAILDKLQEFLLELGHGFCFESRQRRILIGDDYFFIDLVFYHRILKCHILIELKVDSFDHKYLGQLNTYVNWFRKNVVLENDNPPIGLLLCTQKNHTLVEYALSGIDNQLFVSKYQLELPKKEEIQKFLEKQFEELGE